MVYGLDALAKVVIICAKEAVMSSIWLSVSTFIVIVLSLFMVGVLFFAAH